MWDEYIVANNIEDTVNLLNKYGSEARIIAGGTDLVLEFKRGIHKNIRTVIDISRIDGLDKIEVDHQGFIHIGALVTHSQIIKSEILQKHADCLVEACEQIGSPQIRNRGTVVGNFVTASPANDTISALLVMNTTVVIRSSTGRREISLLEFFKGVRKTVLEPNEIVEEFYFKQLEENEKSVFIKHALRKAQAISLLNAAILLKLENNIITDARISLGAVTPIVIRAVEAEKYLIGKSPDKSVCEIAADIASGESSPISDIRSSADYRRRIVKVIVKRGLEKAVSQKLKTKSQTVTLWGKNPKANLPYLDKTITIDNESIIEVEINGKEYKFNNVHQKTLLQVIREYALLTGTKEGCGEGECGACTVYLDGIAVMGCLVPAIRAHKSKVTTIENFSGSGSLNTVQEAFIQEGAVQCGYCTPGFVMSAVKLLEENPNPNTDEIKTAISGNLCRCTGYYKIVKAIEAASKK